MFHGKVLLNRGALAERVATGTLRFAAEVWSSTIKETLTVSEAKRTFLTIKFYLINAARICSEYSHKAVDI